MPRFTWESGAQSELARQADVSRQFMCDVLHRRKRPSPDTAARIAKAAKTAGIPLTLDDLLFPSKSKSPAFLA